MGTELSPPLLKSEPPEVCNKLPADVVQKLQIEMQSLEAKLLAQDPEMRNHLRESHRLLISYPETVHLLSDDGVARLIQAAQQHMKVEIVKESAKGKGASSKKKVSLDDL